MKLSVGLFAPLLVCLCGAVGEPDDDLGWEKVKEGVLRTCPYGSIEEPFAAVVGEFLGNIRQAFDKLRTNDNLLQQSQQMRQLSDVLCTAWITIVWRCPPYLVGKIMPPWVSELTIKTISRAALRMIEVIQQISAEEENLFPLGQIAQSLAPAGQLRPEDCSLVEQYGPYYSIFSNLLAASLVVSDRIATKADVVAWQFSFRTHEEKEALLMFLNERILPLLTKIQALQLTPSSREHQAIKPLYECLLHMSIMIFKFAGHPSQILTGLSLLVDERLFLLTNATNERLHHRALQLLHDYDQWIEPFKQTWKAFVREIESLGRIDFQSHRQQAMAELRALEHVKLVLVRVLEILGDERFADISTEMRSQLHLVNKQIARHVGLALGGLLDWQNVDYRAIAHFAALREREEGKATLSTYLFQVGIEVPDTFVLMHEAKVMRDLLGDRDVQQWLHRLLAHMSADCYPIVPLLEANLKRVDEAIEVLKSLQDKLETDTHHCSWNKTMKKLQCLRRAVSLVLDTWHILVRSVLGDNEAQEEGVPEDPSNPLSAQLPEDAQREPSEPDVLSRNLDRDGIRPGLPRANPRDRSAGQFAASPMRQIAAEEACSPDVLLPNDPPAPEPNMPSQPDDPAPSDLNS